MLQVGQFCVLKGLLHALPSVHLLDLMHDECAASLDWGKQGQNVAPAQGAVQLETLLPHKPHIMSTLYHRTFLRTADVSRVFDESWHRTGMVKTYQLLQPSLWGKNKTGL